MIQLITILSTIPALIAKGYVMSIMWLWFIVPTFDVVEISIPISIGVLFIVGLISHTDSDEIEYNQELAVRIITATIMPFWYLGMGYITLQFI